MRIWPLDPVKAGHDALWSLLVGEHLEIRWPATKQCGADFELSFLQKATKQLLPLGTTSVSSNQSHLWVEGHCAQLGTKNSQALDPCQVNAVQVEGARLIFVTPTARPRPCDRRRLGSQAENARRATRLD